MSGFVVLKAHRLRRGTKFAPTMGAVILGPHSWPLKGNSVHLTRFMLRMIGAHLSCGIVVHCIRVSGSKVGMIHEEATERSLVKASRAVGEAQRS